MVFKFEKFRGMDPKRTHARTWSRRTRPKPKIPRLLVRAQGLLGKFRQASHLAVATTSLVLLASESSRTEDGTAPAEPIAEIGANTISEARSFVSSMAAETADFIPKLIVAVLILILGWISVRLAKKLFRSKFKSWSRVEATSALVSIAIFLFSLGGALSVLTGDVRTLIGSIGLVGLALSWALQGPIESFTGWLLNSFRGYYKMGDRIQVGDVFGDVFKIDILTTTVWQAGGSGQSVQAAQPTGALITFPNSEVLRANIVNYTGDFPYVWDEVAIGVSNDSDLNYTVKVVREKLDQIIAPAMLEPVRLYRSLLKTHNLPYDISEKPGVFAHPTDSWTQIVVRYLVNARERRQTSTDIYLTLSAELALPHHQNKILSGYPRNQVEQLRPKDPR